MRSAVVELDWPSNCLLLYLPTAASAGSLKKQRTKGFVRTLPLGERSSHSNAFSCRPVRSLALGEGVQRAGRLFFIPQKRSFNFPAAFCYLRNIAIRTIHYYLLAPVRPTTDTRDFGRELAKGDLLWRQQPRPRFPLRRSDSRSRSNIQRRPAGLALGQPSQSSLWDAIAAPPGKGGIAIDRTRYWEENLASSTMLSCAARPATARPGSRRRIPRSLLARGVRTGLRGRSAHGEAAAFRRAAGRRGRSCITAPFAELATGEGKTLVASLPTFLNALYRQGRARHHRQRLPGRPRRRVDGPIYTSLGLTVGVLQMQMPDARPLPSLSVRHHLRHRVRIWFRFPARPAQGQRQQGPGRAVLGALDGAVSNSAQPSIQGAARASLRHRRRGRQHLHRRGAHAAHHQRAHPSGHAGGAGRLPLGRQHRQGHGARQALHAGREEAKDRADRRRPADRPLLQPARSVRTRTPWTSCTSTSSAACMPITASGAISTT